MHTTHSKHSKPVTVNEAKAEPKAKSLVKTPSKKKVTVASQVTKAFKNGSKEITLEFLGAGKIVDQLFEVQKQVSTLCIGDFWLPAIPTPNNHLQLPLLNWNQDQPSTPQWSEWCVVFDLTPVPSVDITSNQQDSPWLHLPLDAQPSSLDTFAPNADPPNATDNSPENFNYVFQSPLSPSKPPSSKWSQQKSVQIPSTPTTPSHPHHNHGHQDSIPWAGPHSPNWKSPHSPLKNHRGNQHGKEARDVAPFFSERTESDRQVCKLCQ